MGSTDDDGNEPGVELLNAYVDRTAYASMVGRAIEGGADLVMNDRSIEASERGKDIWELRGHPLWRTGSAIARDPDSFDVWKCRKVRRSRRSEEKDSGHTVRSELLQDVGGTGEVVAVKGIEKRHAFHLMIDYVPKVSSADFNSGCVLA
jgi:hypothetical protein